MFGCYHGADRRGTPALDDSACLIWPFPVLSWFHFKLYGAMLDPASFLSMQVVPVVSFESCVSTILEDQKNVRAPSTDKNAIVDSIHGENDQCAHDYLVRNAQIDFPRCPLSGRMWARIVE
jgi:hypothetical protein